MIQLLAGSAGVIAMMAGDVPHMTTVAPLSPCTNAIAVVMTLEDNTAAPEPAPVWIGVRMAPAPAALKAHLSRGELMVANVVTDSPADRAGLERYDVIVSVDGRTIEDGAALVDAIVAAEPGRPCALVLIRGGREQTLQITPVDRPESPAMSFRYDEPERVVDDSAVRYFGHNLRVGPNGNLLVQPLGRLRDMETWLDQDLGELQIPDIQTWIGDEFDQMKMFQLSPGANAFSFALRLGDDDTNAQHEVSIRVTENGDSTAIHRRADGTVEVTRQSDADEQTTVYDDEEQMQAADPEAYELLRRHSAGGFRTMIVPPALDRLPGLQQGFDEQLRDIRARTQEAIEMARKGRVMLRLQAAAKNAGGAGDATSISVRFSGSGYVIDIDENGTHKRCTFDTLDDLREGDPDLYERIRPLIDDAEQRGRINYTFATAMT
jgi:hypothetical protein